MEPPDLLIATVSKTTDGKHDYLQVLSGDQFTLNIVLIGRHIKLVDQRPKRDPLRDTLEEMLRIELQGRSTTDAWRRAAQRMHELARRAVTRQ